MVIAKPMDHDDDVEHLFSWLQTPELRYREFAGAREITDTVVTWQARTNTAEPETAEAVPPAHGNVQLQEEYPPDQFPDQSAVRVQVVPVERGPVERGPVERGPAMIAPVPERPIEPTPSVGSAGPFALGAAGRTSAWRPIEEPLAPPPASRVSNPAVTAGGVPAPPVAPPPAQTAPPPAARIGRSAAGWRASARRAYRENALRKQRP